MTRRAGSADPLLHGGRLPRWLANCMMRLGAMLALVIVAQAGNDRSRKAR